MASPPRIEDRRRPRERHRAHVRVVLDVAEDLRDRDLASDEEQEHRGERAHEAREDALEHERPADVPVRGADELHHLDLAAPREDREPDRVRDQDRRGREQDDDDDPEDDLDAAGDLQDPLRDLLAVAHLVDGRRASPSGPRPRSPPCPRRAWERRRTTPGSGFDARLAVRSGLRLRMISSAFSFVMNVMPPGFTRLSDSRWMRNPLISFFVAPSATKTCTASSRFLSSDHETSQVPSPMKTPMRNIPMRTESADATVVETFAPIERSASAKSVRSFVILPRTPRAARRGRACPTRAR